MKRLSSRGIYKLLLRIDEGHLITDAEKKMLSSVRNIEWRTSSITNLPNSMGLLTSLSELRVYSRELSDISALSNLASLSVLDVSGTKVSDISVLSNMKTLSHLGLRFTKVSDIGALSNLAALSTLDVSGTEVSDISVLSNMKTLSHLGLRFTKVSDIGALSNMASLLTLDVSGTKVSDIRALSNLRKLESLDLSNTGVNDISALSKLTSLEFLSLRETRIREISALSDMTSLIILSLNYTGVSDIRALSNLRKLKSLDLSNTGVSDISVLSKVTSLSYFNLNNTQVNDISALSGLNNLNTLELSEIEIKDLHVISGLTALKRLNLQNSKTSAIPESMLGLELRFILENQYISSLTSDEGIYIHGLTLTDQPIEIFSQRRELIRAYYRERDKVPVNECKVIFLGDAESGKTHSIKRLLNNGEFLKDFDGESTPGIEITVNPTKLANSDIVINYWDFGGQEIQHSMHRVFLTERTVYVVFLNARQDDLMDERAKYWMENIKAFAPDAPVLVVINKIDQNEHPRFNEKGFMDSYGNQVKKVIRLSAKKDEKQLFLDKLQGNINNIIIDLPTVRKKIPKSWKNLMENIRGMSDHYLTTEQFTKKCQANRIKDYKKIHDELVDLFQVIGISFCYYKNRAVADYLLLNPKWMLNALYTVVTNGKAVAQNGVITQNNLYDLLEKDTLNGFTIRRVIPELRYKGFEVNYILGVIRMFGLSYGLQDGSEFFPMLCVGDEKISVKDAVPADALHFIFRYTYLPTK